MRNNMNNRILSVITIIMVLISLCSCSDKSLDAGIEISTGISTENRALSKKITDYKVDAFEYNNANNLNVIDGKCIFTYIENCEQNDSYISVYNTSTENTEKINIDITELAKYNNNEIKSLKQYGDLLVYTGVSSMSDEFGKIFTNCFIGLYDLKTNNNKIKVTNHRYIDEIMYNSDSNQLIYQTDESFCVYDMDLNMLSSVDFGGIISEYVSGCDYYQTTSVMDYDGSVYLDIVAPGKNSVYKFNKDFDVEWIITDEELAEFPGYVEIGVLRNGSVALYSCDAEYWYVNIIDSKTADTTERYEIENNGNQMLFNASSDGDYIMLSDGYFELYNLENNQKVNTVMFDNCDLMSWRTYSYNSENIYCIELPGSYISDVAVIMDYNGNVTDKYEIIGEQISGNYIFDGKGGFYSKSENNHSLIHNNTNGVEYLEIAASPGFELCAAADNFLYKFDDEFELYDSNGALICQFTLDCSEFVAFLSEEGNEKLYYVNSKNDLMFYDVKLETKEKTDISECITDSEYRVYFDGSVHDFYFLDNSKLYIYDIERETCEELLSDTSGISLNSSGIKVLNENGNMVCCDFNNVYIFTPLNYENDRIAVNVAYFGEISCVPFDVIRKYNENSSKYVINTYKYENIEELNYDISLDNIPDILISDGDMSLKRYADMNMFADLSEFWNKDSEVNRDDYFENLISLYSNDKGIFRIFPSFSVSSFGVIGESIFNNNDFTNLNSFCTRVNSSDNCFLVESEGMEKMLSAYLPVYIYESSDKNVINFKTENFREFIKILKNRVKNIDFYDENFRSLYLNNNYCLVRNVMFTSENSISKLMNELDNQFILTGYPGDKGPYMYVAPDICYSISEKSECKEEAWEIVRDCFYSGLDTASFSVNKKVFDADFRMIQDNTDEKVIAEDIKKFIADADYAFETDKNVEDIVVEEIQNYIYGNAESDAVIDSIQNRVNIYLSELQH